MKRISFREIFLLVIAAFLGLIALRPLIPEKVEAQAHPSMTSTLSREPRRCRHPTAVLR